MAMSQLQDENIENCDPSIFSQPMPNTRYVPGTSRLLTITGNIRDQGIIELQRENERRIVRWRITLLTRYMVGEPFPGPAIIHDLRSYYGLDYYSHDLEDWLRIIETAQMFCDPMTHDEYLLMRTARLTMMRTMLSEIRGVRYSFPALWYTFDNMGHLLDSLTTWHYPLIGQMALVNDFFNNPGWLPTDPQAAPTVIMLQHRHAPTTFRSVFHRSYSVGRTSTEVRNELPHFTPNVRNLR